MKFKILPGTDLFTKLWEVQKSIQAANASIKKQLKKMGYEGVFANGNSSQYIVSCDAIEIKGGKPDGWKSVGESHQQLYYPLARNKKDMAALAELPRIPVSAINDPLGFSFCIGEGLSVYHRPGVHFHKEYVLVDTGEAPYKPVKDMVEILESEFTKLKKAIK